MLRTTTYSSLALILLLLTKYSTGHVCVTGPPENSQPTTDPSTTPSTTSSSSSASPPSSTSSTTQAPSTPSTKSVTDAYPTSALDGANAFLHGKKVVCYYGSWAVYRPDKGKYPVELMDPHICTHYIYTFAGLGYDNRIRSLDPWNDLKDNYGKGAFERFTNLKKINPKLKTLIAIGGWNEGSIKYSSMAADPSARGVFVKSVVDFLKLYNFDGLDLDWEYPAARGGKPEDKENFASLTRELRQAFNPHGYLLTAAVSAGKWFIDPGYDVPEVSRNLDLINVMCYDYHGGWEEKTGHNAPMYARPDETGIDRISNVNFSINYWIERGAPREKIILGMGTYGRSFTLQRAEVNGLGAPAPQKGQAGPYTREPGSLGYNEICTSFKREKWTIKNDPNHMAPYAYNDRQWVGYDDIDSIAIKTRFASAMDLGGGMIWSIETDDFLGECHGVKYPLLKTINRVFMEKAKPPVPTPSPGPNKPDVVTSTPTTSGPPSSTEWWQSSNAPSSTSTTTTSTTTQSPSSTWWPTSSSSSEQPSSSTEWWASSTSTSTSTTAPTASTSKSDSNTPDIHWWTYGTPASRTTVSTFPHWTSPSTQSTWTSPSTQSTWTTWTTVTTPPSTTASPSSPGPSVPDANDDPKCKEDGMFRHPRDCRRFYRCVDIGSGGRFVSYEYTCPSDTVFDETSKLCLWAQSVPECSSYYSGHRNHHPQPHQPKLTTESPKEPTTSSSTTSKPHNNEVEREEAPVSSINDP